ncbi:MAG: hypothetical protein HQ542_02295 [Bacteroidia bacterium]|nr:hypothetical protein [Bacteroidia bacterium]
MNQIAFTVAAKVLSSFTTLLQSGIYLSTTQGTGIGTLLTTLPGFTEEYASQRVQTIFLNGLPADDLQQQLFGNEAVVALSAAMPGLAGAIFRKGGVHASLRTETANELSETGTKNRPIQVRLKLFNMIAVERGVQILDSGCAVMASALGKFLAYRPPLLAAIERITMNNRDITPQTLTSLLQSEEMVTLTIRSNHAS